MAVQKNFVIRNGLEVNNNLLVADSSTDHVGVGTSSPKYTLEVIGGIGATFSNILGISTVVQEFNVGTGGTVITSLDTGLTGFGTATPAYIVDIRSPVSTGQTALYVQGDVRVTGDVYADDISLDQATFTNLEVTGIATISSLAVVNPNKAILTVGHDVDGSGQDHLGIYYDNTPGTPGTGGTANIFVSNGDLRFDVVDGVSNFIFGSQFTNNYVTINGTDGALTVAGLVTTTDAYIGFGTVVILQSDDGIITTLSGDNIDYSGIGSFGSVNANIGRINTGIVTNLVTTGIASVNTGVITSAYVTTGIVTTLTGITLDYSGIGTIANFKATSATVSGLTTTGSLAVSSGFDVYGTDSTFHGSVTIDGNLSIGGTSAILNAVQVRVEDKDIILGFTTAITPSDDTANHGGVAVASTEGYPLVSLAVSGINTLPDTYKQIMWVKRNTMGAGTTDAFLFNYAVGVGSTQVPNGVRFAVGGIQFTDTIINTTNLNATGVTTSNSYNVGGTQVISSGRELQNIASLDATTTATIEAAIANAPNTSQDIVVTGIASINTGVFTSLYSPTGIITTLSGANINYSGIGTFGTASVDLGYVKTGIVTNLTTSGIATITTAVVNTGYITTGVVTTLSGTTLNYSGLSTIGNFSITPIGSGATVGNSGIVTYYGDGSYLTGNARNLTATIGVGTTGGVAGYGVSFIQFAGPGVSTVYYNGTAGIATVTITGGGGSGSASIGIGSTPGDAFVGVVTSGNLWYNTNLGRLFIYYQDTDSAQWVDAAPFNIGIVTSLITSLTLATQSASNPSLSFIGDTTTGLFSPGTGQQTFVSAGASVLNINSSGVRVTGIVTSTSVSTGNINSSGIITSTSVSTGNINSSGIVTATDFDALSDIRYKENIATVDSALSKVDQLRGVKFDWKESGLPSYGVIAQELEEVLPELVHGGDPKTVNYNGIIGVLIEAIKELKAEVEELKKDK